MRMIAIANQKGGSAKTTTAIHLAAGLHHAGRRVLLVDMDPQGHVGEGLGVNLTEWYNRPDISTVLDRKHTLSQAILHIETADLDAVLATDQLAFVEYDLRDKYRREDRLKLALAAVAADYDYAIIDCPPSLSLLTVNAFTAASDVLIPMASEYFALRGVERLLATIDGIRAEINPELAVLGVLPTRVGRTVNAREAIAGAHQLFDHVTRVLDLQIPETVKFREAAALGITIFDHAPGSPGAQAYLALAKEIDCDGQ
jgi:chromosome partitioning protein